MEKNKLEQFNECEIIADLLPIYLDHATQEETNSLIEEHLARCEDCKKNYEWMKSSFGEILNEDNEKPRKKKKNKMFKKVKWKMFLYGYVFLLIAVWLYCILDLIYGL